MMFICQDKVYMKEIYGTSLDTFLFLYLEFSLYNVWSFWRSIALTKKKENKWHHKTTNLLILSAEFKSSKRCNIVCKKWKCGFLVGWDYRIYRLHLCRGVRRSTLTNECLGYDTKQSDGEVPVMVELWGMQSTLSLRSLPGPLWLGVVAPDRALSMG